MTALDFSDILRARETLTPLLRPTPLYPSPGLSRLLAAEVWVKHENHHPTGAFKVRGALNFVARLSPAQRAGGVFTASSGNLGAGTAYAAHRFGIRAVVYLPGTASPARIESVEEWGAEVRRMQPLDRQAATDAARREGAVFLSPDEPAFIAGMGTMALETFESLADVDALFVPVSTGTSAAGTCLAARALSPRTQVIGVQAEAAQAAYLSWKENRPVTAPSTTMAEGLSARVSFDVPQAILRGGLADFLLVSETELHAAMRTMIEKTRNLVEAAGAASLAGALKMRERLAGKRVALVLSGGNASVEQLRELL